MNNIVSVKLDSRYASTLGVWQYDYGQVLRITGPELPPAVEVQFSLTEKSGETLSRVGTTVDGVTEVKIPDELLTHSAASNYRIYAYIYLTDETSGNTKYEITIPVRVRSKPTSPAEDPETDPDLFRETVVAVNASAERAKMAEQNAKESATEAGKYAASASESAVTAEKTKEDALRKVGEKKREAIEAIQNQEETSVGKITTHTDGEIQRIQNQATESKGELEQTITNADASKKELEHSIETAGTSKTALDKSVELAGTAKTELDTSIREAGTAKTALDESTETAGTVQETLSATVNQAGALDTSLGEKIETGTQLKTDLVASGEKAVQDIRAAGSEQLGKMQAVAEAFTADREQIAKNKEDIGSLKEDLSNKITKFYASNQGETHITDSDNGKIQDMIIYGRSSQFTTTGKNLAHGKNEKYYINTSVNLCGFNNNDIGMAIDVSNLTNVTISTRSIQDKYRIGCVDTVPTDAKTVTCYNGRNKDGTKDSYTIDTKDYNYLIVNATKLEDIQVEKGSEATSYEPYTGGIPSPSPDYPQEIKSVVNPTVEVRGANLLKLSFVNKSNNGVTIDVVENKIRFHGTIRDTYAYWRLDNQLLIKKGTKVSLYVDNYNNHAAFVWFRKVDDYGSLQTLSKRTTNIILNNDSYLSQIGIENYTVGDTIDFTATFAVLDNTNQYEPYHEQTVTLPYTLNAIPVKSGGNVTINGQQYIADYVDVERGKVVRMCERKKLNTKNGAINEEYRLAFDIAPYSRIGNDQCIFSAFEWTAWTTCTMGSMAYIKNIQKPNDEFYTAQELKELSLDFEVVYQLAEKQEIDLTTEQTQAFKALATYYPTTNISVNSEQLDGYTVFNYPISMANGWNYVKQQLGDTRDYIYDMDAKAQDIDIQSAEAYVNSEYAVALTELEV